MTSVVVRPARPDDLDRVRELTLAAYRADGQTGPGSPYERVLADVESRAREGELLVAEDEATGRVVGAVLFVLPGSHYAELCRPGEAEFRTLAVDPAAQRRGVGELLVRACLDRARDRGCRAVVISVRDVAHAAQRLYARLGFVRSPEQDWTPVPDVRLLALRYDLRADDRSSAQTPGPGPSAG